MIRTLMFTITFTFGTLLAAGGAWAHQGKQHPPGEHDVKKPAASAAPATAPASAGDANAHAPGDHAHESPHGGIVTTIDKDTHVEVKLDDKHLDVWFYDAAMKPIALPTDAKATAVIGKDVKKLELPIAKRADGTPDDHLSAALTSSADQKVALVIQATLLGKSRTARVERKAGAAAASAPVNAPAQPAPAPKGSP